MVGVDETRELWWLPLHQAFLHISGHSTRLLCPGHISSSLHLDPPAIHEPQPLEKPGARLELYLLRHNHHPLDLDRLL